MDLITGGAALPGHLRGGIVALGNFDGFHAGHQAVVGAARDWARKLGRPALVASFDPHPARLFQPDVPPFSLSTIDQRGEWLGQFGMDGAVVMPFNRALAALSAEEFVDEWLVTRLGVAGVVTGGDFTFGRGRSGSVTDLERLGLAHGFAARVVDAVQDGAGTISSTRIRALLRDARPGMAAELLTRPFTIRGVVEHGAKLGRTLGFPTANMTLGDYVRPAYGVYAVQVVLPNGERVDGVANLGIRPMIEPRQELLETWLMDWSGDLYGQTLDVQLVAYLRPEMKLNGLDALKAQIAADAEAARRMLKGG
ncbi:bifunctional riboflavin kinase/FAD synthetase [Sandarakinorhabdus limnophila]|uniref:bifunctional riboflavin kinase/FAD synthetase n=1 Tax=Sandarakinorhabdus limnophila TaxID=210512 RepID=UPI0026EFE4FD|nr:bifunctional riboflavin kinase/FAD synthetase [Sandarakinorhabdus limnophila]MCM0033513.1 bifunctional riboflavin kinase/FAD synthetase [Sandarakinorhabdus limnophila]